MELQDGRKIKLTPEEVEKETVLSVMAERQHNEPSEKNLESFFSALKDSQVYVPVRIILDKSLQKQVQEALKAGKQVDLGNKVRFSPVLMVNNKTKETVLPVYSRESEYYDEKKKNQLPPFIRLPIVKLIELADNMPEAFDLIFDINTHPVRLTLDQVEFGIGYAEAAEKEEQDG